MSLKNKIITGIFLSLIIGFTYLLLLLIFYSHDISIKNDQPSTLAEGTDGVMVLFGGWNHECWVNKVNAEIYFNAGAHLIAIGADTISGTLYVKDSTYNDTTFHWKVVAQRKLYAWGWRTIYSIEIGLPIQELPKNIFGWPLARATYCNGRLTKCVPLGI